MPMTYASRKAKMDRDPAFRERVLSQQRESRRRTRQRREQGTEPAHYQPDGRPCWRTDEHQHRTG